MASQFSDQELRECFDAMDTDKSGFVVASELAEGLKSLGCTDKEAEEYAEAIVKDDDKNKDSKISFEEFKKGFFSQ